jgi:hypothetical protein
MKQGALVFPLLFLVACCAPRHNEIPSATVAVKKTVEIEKYPIRVLDSEKQPVKGAKVLIMCGQNEMPQGLTDEEGYAVVDLSELNQPFMLWVTCPSQNANISSRYENPPPLTGITVSLPCVDSSKSPLHFIPPGPTDERPK